MHIYLTTGKKELLHACIRIQACVYMFVCFVMRTLGIYEISVSIFAALILQLRKSLHVSFCLVCLSLNCKSRVPGNLSVSLFTADQDSRTYKTNHCNDAGCCDFTRALHSCCIRHQTSRCLAYPVSNIQSCNFHKAAPVSEVAKLPPQRLCKEVRPP